MIEDEARQRFADVVMPQADHAFRLALWLTRNRDDAEDVVQDASLRAFRAIGDFAGASPRAWFLTIVRRTAYTWIAKNRPKDLVATDDLEAAERDRPEADPGFGVRPLPSPEAILLAKQESGRVRGAIEALPVRFREALVLRDLEEMSYREIAGTLDVPIGTVMSRLARARAMLMRDLAEVE